MPRAADPFKKRWKWVMEDLQKRGIAIGGVQISGDTFTILTPEGAQSKLDPYDHWKKTQEKK